MALKYDGDVEKKKLVGAGKLMATLINLGGAFTPPPLPPTNLFLVRRRIQ